MGGLKKLKQQTTILHRKKIQINNEEKEKNKKKIIPEEQSTFSKMYYLGKNEGFKSDKDIFYTIDDVTNGSTIDYFANEDKVLIKNKELVNENFLEGIKDKSENFKIELLRTHLKINSDSDETGLYDLWDDELKSIDPIKANESVANAKHAFSLMFSPGKIIFGNNFLSVEQWQKVFKKNILQLFKVNRWKQEDFQAFFTIHINTDYPHINLLLVGNKSINESKSFASAKFKKINPDPNDEDRKNKLWLFKGYDEFRANVRRDIAINEQIYTTIREKMSEISDIRKAIRDISKSFNVDLLEKIDVDINSNNVSNLKNEKTIINTPEELTNLCLRILTKAKTKDANFRDKYIYSKLGQDTKRNIRSVINYLEKEIPELKNLHNLYDKKIKEFEDLMSKQENYDVKLSIQLQLQKEKKEFENGLGNDIVNAIRKSEIQAKKYKANNSKVEFKKAYYGFFLSKFAPLETTKKQILKSYQEFRADTVEELEELREKIALGH